MEHREKLVKTVAHSLGYYMAARFMGKDGTRQLQRYKRLGKALEEYDKTNKYAILHQTKEERADREEIEEIPIPVNAHR